MKVLAAVLVGALCAAMVAAQSVDPAKLGALHDAGKAFQHGLDDPGASVEQIADLRTKLEREAAVFVDRPGTPEEKKIAELYADASRGYSAARERFDRDKARAPFFTELRRIQDELKQADDLFQGTAKVAPVPPASPNPIPVAPPPPSPEPPRSVPAAPHAPPPPPPPPAPQAPTSPGPQTPPPPPARVPPPPEPTAPALPPPPPIAPALVPPPPAPAPPPPIVVAPATPAEAAAPPPVESAAPAPPVPVAQPIPVPPPATVAVPPPPPPPPVQAPAPPPPPVRTPPAPEPPAAVAPAPSAAPASPTIAPTPEPAAPVPPPVRADVSLNNFRKAANHVKIDKDARAVSGCPKISTITVPNSGSGVYEVAGHNFYYDNTDELIRLRTAEIGGDRFVALSRTKTEVSGDVYHCGK